MRAPAVVLTLLLVAVPACTKEKKPATATDELQVARGRLAVLAQATANGAYDAQYRFRQLPTNTSGVIRIRQAPPQYRIDIISKDGASFFALKTGVVSCSTKGTKKTCFKVARPGEEVPALFDPGVQRLFRDAVEDLAAHPSDYLVTKVDAPPSLDASGTPAPAGGSAGASGATGSGAASATPSPAATPSGSLPIPVGECFRVERVAATPAATKSGFEDGTYCFAEQGVATAIAVESGTMTLVKLLGPPTPGAFMPPAKVQTLPNLSPTPSPTKKKK